MKKKYHLEKTPSTLIILVYDVPGEDIPLALCSFHKEQRERELEESEETEKIERLGLPVDDTVRCVDCEELARGFLNRGKISGELWLEAQELDDGVLWRVISIIQAIDEQERGEK